MNIKETLIAVIAKHDAAAKSHRIALSEMVEHGPGSATNPVNMVSQSLKLMEEELRIKSFAEKMYNEILAAEQKLREDKFRREKLEADCKIELMKPLSSTPTDEDHASVAERMHKAVSEIGKIQKKDRPEDHAGWSPDDD